MAQLSKEAIEKGIIAIVEEEHTQWENPLVFITDRIAFRYRDLIRTCRRNFWGIFDNPKDPITGRERTWYPLTQEFCTTGAIGTDLDTKNMNFRARNADGYKMTELTRAKAQEYFQSTYFGEDLDQEGLQLMIDGTTVWKTWEGKDEKGKPVIERKAVDVLNFFIDPVSESIQKAQRVTERAVMTAEDIKGMTGWANTAGVENKEGINPNDATQYSSIMDSNTKGVDVYELWGLIPNKFITGNDDDEDLIEGHAVVSGLQHGEAIFHFVEENKNFDKNGKVIKPYEEDRLLKSQGRWAGIGMAERLIPLQVWINTIINIRISRAYVSQLGLWKIRQGSGVRKQNINKLGANGVIVVQNMDDVQQFITDEASEGSYKDEDSIRDLAQRITQISPLVTGEPLPASTTATTAVIQSNASQSSLTHIRESRGLFLQRWFDRHVLPVLSKQITMNDIVKLSVDDDRFSELAERVAMDLVSKEVDELHKQGLVPSEESVIEALEIGKEKLRQKSELFLEVTQKIIAKNMDTVFFVTNEDMNVGVMADKLTALAGQVDPQFRTPMIRQIYDLLGVPVPQSLQGGQQVSSFAPEEAQAAGAIGAPPSQAPAAQFQGNLPV